MFGLDDKTIQVIKQTLTQFKDIESALIIGSRAIGNYKKGSDIDIALKGKNISSDTIYKLRVILEEETILPYMFDIVDYNTINNMELKNHVDQFGVVFY